MSLLFVAGDTPASALLGGFKESVAASRPCRSCLASNDDWMLSFREENFVQRNAETHRNHCDAITEQGAPADCINYWKKYYGVNKASPLMSICDVTQCLPQDIMHVLLEGVCEVTIRAHLRYYILERRLFTVEELNERIDNFDFGLFKDNKPGIILQQHIQRDNTLKQTASQLFNLLHTLPFLTVDFIGDENDDEQISLYTL